MGYAIVAHPSKANRMLVIVVAASFVYARELHRALERDRCRAPRIRQCCNG